MSALRWLWLILAVLGAMPALPVAHYLWTVGFGFDHLRHAVMANEVTMSIGADLLISAIVLTLWILAEVSVRRNWSALLAIPATFLIGVSCGLPLYLFLRTRPV